MAQYDYYTNPDTGLKVRDGVRDENNDGLPEYVIDRELTPDGFSGVKNVNWECIETAE